MLEVNSLMIEQCSKNIEELIIERNIFEKTFLCGQTVCCKEQFYQESCFFSIKSSNLELSNSTSDHLKLDEDFVR